MSAQQQDIAIIGMAGLYPCAPTVSRFWNNILAKVDAVSDAPESWNAARYHNPAADGNDSTHTYCRRGGFIEPFAEFDPLEYGIMPGSVDGSDPGHFLCLRVAAEALADADVPRLPLNRSRTAVILGHGSYPHRGTIGSIGHGVVEDFFALIRKAVPEIPESVLEPLVHRLKERLPPATPDICPGLISNVLAGRIANRFDLMGPNYLVDAACASSLIALDAGMRELRSGTCDAALVGGAQENTHAGIFTVFSMLGALSRTGKLRPFDRSADGTLLSEGIGMMVLKRRADAERDGHRIYAVVKGVGLSSDGRAQAFLVPRLEGEIAAMERAYERTGIDPATVELIEAHGTGTVVGDRTEVKAMTRLFGARAGKLPRCAVGSVKSMIGHTLPAAGMAGLIKTAWALYHKTLPPTLCDEPSGELGFEESALYLNTETRPWIHGAPHPRRAAVNAFGFGGINAHAVLEEYADAGAPVALAPGAEWECELFVLRATARADVRERARALSDALAHDAGRPLRAIADALQSEAAPEGAACLAIVATSVDDLRAKLDAATEALGDPQVEAIHQRDGTYYFDRPLAREGTLAFLLPGEGAQYAGMLSDLCLHFDEVRRWFDRADRAFLERGRDPLPSRIVFPPPHLTAAERRRVEKALWSIEYAVPLIAAADCAFFHLMFLLGVRPRAVSGHSAAQDLAIHAAAAFDRLTPETIVDSTIVEDRVLDHALQNLVPAARLLSVGASEPARVAALAAEKGLYVAMDNCPNQVVLCGAPETVEAARAILEAEGALCQYLPFDRAYHTPLYRPICDRIERTMGDCAELIPRIPVYASTTGQRLPETAAGIRRIMIDQWAEPIRFRETIETMYADGVRIFLETGPRGNLTGFVDDTLNGREYAAIPCDVPSRGGLLQLHHALALLCAHGVQVNLEYLHTRRRIPASGGTPHRPAGPRIKLRMDIPSVAPDEEGSAQLRQALEAALRGPASSPPAVLSSDPHAPRPDDPLLQAHHRTMAQLAALHEEVMQSALGSGQIE